MTTLTLTPDPLRGIVTIVLADATGVTSLIRSDANGSRPVRLRPGQLPASGVVTIIDYEPAISSQIQYRTTGALSEHAWTRVAATLPRFVIPALPTFWIVADMVTAYNSTRSSRSTFHEVINRPDPLVSVASLGTRSGSLDVWFSIYAEAVDLESMLNRGYPLMFRQAENPGQDMYFYAESTSIRPDEDGWILALAYREVLSPAGFVLTSTSWSFDTLAATGGTFDAVAANYATFQGLLLNKAGQ